MGHSPLCKRVPVAYVDGANILSRVLLVLRIIQVIQSLFSTNLPTIIFYPNLYISNETIYSKMPTLTPLRIPWIHSAGLQQPMSQSTPDTPDSPALTRLSPCVSTHDTMARVTALGHLKRKTQNPMSTRQQA